MSELSDLAPKAVKRTRARQKKLREERPVKPLFKVIEHNEKAREAYKRGWVPPKFVVDEADGSPLVRCANCKAGRHDLCTTLKACRCEHAKERGRK